MADSASDLTFGSQQDATQEDPAPHVVKSGERLVVLNVCETAQGGVGRYQDALAALADHGFQSHVLLPDSDIGILTDPSRATTFSRLKRGPRATIQMLRVFLSERKRLKPDLYFFHSTFALLPLLALRLRRDKTPAVYCAHSWAANSDGPDTFKKRVIRSIEGRLCGLADMIVNVSRSDAGIARQFEYRGRHVVVENAVTEPLVNAKDDLFPRPARDTINLLFVGRFDHQKGLDILLDAFRQAQGQNPALHLHLVGEPVRGGAVPPLPPGTTHHGWVAPDQIDHYFRSADCLVVPSRWEGLPLVIPEAYRNGTPVLAARTSGMEHLIEDGQTGHSFPLDRAALVALLLSLERPALTKMGQNARLLYERRFTIDRFSREMAAHLHDLVSSKAEADK
ncbi:glycosyltransferase family 4 protein [Tropicibacter sp. R16_0]|uniref:glycosyltransferase family 4 protein n=1 Tax=Tropicibacter sp. R16_0 TaxID=2821102 RepID=UPI001AD968CE|nr:glycosyltransferase family 4 protein [Tropicibacter sp. R16_0]MBO9448942.1 glycosyltransferase family 4 protein [Tropicibacter sp. R16_0]